MDGVADTPEKMERYLKTVYNKANDMQRLIDELTFYSRLILIAFHTILEKSMSAIILEIVPKKLDLILVQKILYSSMPIM